MRKEMTGDDKRSRERKLTWMMFCVVILFILSNTHFLSHILLGTNCISEKTFSILRPIYSLLYVINSSANLFIYLYFNNKFRNHFIAIFSCTQKNQNVLTIKRLLIVTPIIQNPNVLKIPFNNKDSIKQTAVFYENTSKEILL
jgi:hypothetical protein